MDSGSSLTPRQLRLHNISACATSTERSWPTGRRASGRCGLRRAKAYVNANHIGQGKLKNMVMISERPAEVKDRAVPGHWEGDRIFGKKMTSVGTLVERHSRYVILLKLQNGHGAEAVRKAMTKRILTLPAQLRRSITWDQGKEMAEHVQFTVETGVQIYFCDPKSPWQRGSNENTRGLLRQYRPKSSDLSQCTQRELDAIARSLNTRPRQTLGWMTPSQAFAEVVAFDRLRPNRDWDAPDGITGIPVGGATCFPGSAKEWAGD